MDRQTRLVWVSTGIAVGLVWIVGLNVDRRERRARKLDATSAPAEQAEPTEPTAARAPANVAAPAPKAAPASAQLVEERPNPAEILPPAFASETPDPSWAKDAEATIRSAFADAHVPEGALLSVECRRRVCRAEMWFDPREHAAFSRAYESLHGPFGIEVGFQNLANGIRGEPERLAAYFPRNGYALKDFERR